MLELGRLRTRHVKQDYLFPSQTPEEFSLLFIIKTGWTGNLIQILSTSDLLPIAHLFRISLTSTSLKAYNEKGESVSFALEPSEAEWRQLAFSVVKGSVALYKSCEEAPLKAFPRNLTLWQEGSVIVGDEDHDSDDHFEVGCNQ